MGLYHAFESSLPIAPFRLGDHRSRKLFSAIPGTCLAVHIDVNMHFPGRLSIATLLPHFSPCSLQPHKRYTKVNSDTLLVDDLFAPAVLRLCRIPHHTHALLPDVSDSSKAHAYHEGTDVAPCFNLRLCTTGAASRRIVLCLASAGSDQCECAPELTVFEDPVVCWCCWQGF